MNSSFSPPALRMWDCRLHSDGVSQEPHGVRGSSASSRSRNWMGSDQFTNHHHSVSDGALSFSDSPPDNIQRNRWTSPLPKFHLSELSSAAAGGSRIQTSWLPRSAERPFPVRANVAASPSLGSSSPLSESGQWESTSISKRPSRSFNNRRSSHTSKAVYPLMFRNPVSDCETLGGGDADSSSFGQVTPSSSGWPDQSPSIEYKFQKTLMELHETTTSPDPSASSRRDGFRWSSASSYDMALDIGEHQHQHHQLDFESLKSSVDQKCGVCSKLLWQKSPWSSNRIMRGGVGDMPTAGVLHCAHVFHAECLEQVTPKTQVHDPPCPLCLKTIGGLEGGESAAGAVAEPLLRSIRRSRGQALTLSDDHRSDSKEMIIRTKAPPCEEESSSSLASRLKKHFAMKGKSGKVLFHRTGSSSS